MQDRQTKIIHIHATHPEPEYIAEAAALLQKGELVVFPTETVYGLGANALVPQAAERIFTAKGRPLNDPLIVHIADEAELEMLVTHVPETAQQLVRAFWPGPLTLVMPAGPRVPKLITAGLPNVAIRMPNHPVARTLIQAAGIPVAAPSANRFMHVSPTTAQHVYADLQGRVPLILDGGPTTVGVESTVLDVSTEVPIILRPGGVSLETLRTVVPAVQPPRTSNNSEQKNSASASPGQMLIHYSPSIPTYLIEGTPAEIRTLMLAKIAEAQQRGERVGLLVADADIPTFKDCEVEIYGLGSSLEEIATRLYAGLRTLEETQIDVIYCRSFTRRGLGLAIQDRLQKAAGGKIIKPS